MIFAATVEAALEFVRTEWKINTRTNELTKANMRQLGN